MVTKKNFLLKIGILSVSLILVSSLSISPAIPAIEGYFDHISASSIELMTTVPSFSVMIMVLLSSFISNKIGEKVTVILGLSLVLVAGVLPFFLNDFSAVFLSRIILGVGLGLINSLAVSLISINFKGKESAYLMGLRSAFESGGQAILTFLAGQLILFNWQSVFLIYLLALPILLLFMFSYPDNKKKDSDVEIDNRKQSVNFYVILIAVFLVVIVGAQTAIIIRISGIVTSFNFGNMVDASRVQTLMTVAGMILGVFFGRIFISIRYFTASLGLIMMTMAHFLVYSANNLMVITVGAVLAGAAYPLLISLMFHLVSEVCRSGSETLCMSVALVGCNLGGSSAPYLLKLIALITGSKAINQPFLSFAFLFAVLTILSWFFCRKRSLK
ncbi:MFS transporter [Enterococcus sp. AZ103]|uniref:MFS transporter n=1 Tax=Enterococcus sp. AZ103 TaxID=2774628 RepID=UPI003F2663AC